MNTSVVSIGVIAFCATSLFLAVAQSQEAAPTARERAGRLEEIVVTARRRDESLIDVPVSIVYRSSEYLERAQVENVTELDRVVPGFVFDEYEGGGQSTVSIRGLSTFSNETHAPQSVGILIDDVVLDTVGSSISQFSDISRIEVLRGPQGTLFGRNTTGGVVHIITNDPSEEFEGKASVGYGSYDEVKFNGTVNGPIAENLAARASAFAFSRDGYIENIFNGEMLGSEEQVGVRTKFLYTPDENTRVKLSLTYVDRDQNGVSSGGGYPVVAFGPFATDQNHEVNGAIAGPENDKVNGVGSHSFNDRVAAAGLIWEQAIGEFDLTSITAYEYWKWEFGEDAPFRTFNDPVEPLFWNKFFVPHELNGWSQEVRLASPTGQRWQYVVGAFISGTDSTERRDFLANVGDDPDPAAAIYIFDFVDQDTEHLDYALFGEADIHVTDAWTLTAGARWTRDETDITVDAAPAPFLIPQIGIGIGPLGELYIPFLDSEFPGIRSLSVSDDELTWRAGLRWQPAPDRMFYGSVATGFKGPTITALSILSRVEPETVTSYEVGAKAGFLDNRVSASLTVFNADIEDFQAEGSDTLTTPAGEDVTSIFLTNAAETRNRGVEFELSAAPTDQLTLDIGVAYIDAEFKSYPSASCYPDQTEAEGCTGDPGTQDLSGKRMPVVPEWSGNAAVNYDFTLPFWSLMNSLRVDYSYRDEVNWSNALAPLTVSDAVGIWGLALTFRSPDERLELVGYVKNLTDEYVVNGMDGGNGQISAQLLPEYQRTWGITCNFRTR